MTPKKLSAERLEELIAVLSPQAFQAVKGHIRAVEAERDELAGWKKIDRKDYPLNFDKMSHSRDFMLGYCEGLTEERDALRAELAEWKEIARTAELNKKD